MIGNCAAAFNQSASSGPWRFVGPAGTGAAVKGGCPGGGADWFGYSIDELPTSPTGFAVSTANTGVTILGAKVWWRAYGSFTIEGGFSNSHSFAEITDAAAPGEGSASTTHGAVRNTTNNVWDTTASPAEVSFPASDHATSVALTERCVQLETDHEGCPMPEAKFDPPRYEGRDLAMQIFGAELTLADNAPPNAALSGGSLSGPSPISGPASLAFTASDAQAGVAKAELLVDGAPVATDDYASSCTYTDLQACPGSESDQLLWDTNSVAPGAHALALRVTDAAGNSTVSAANRITTLGGPAARGHIANGTPCPHPTLVASVAGRARTATVRFGRHATVSGRLGCGSTPIPGATIAVGISMRSGAHPSRPVAIRTRADGTFRYQIAAGPSRSLSFSYRAYADEPSPAAQAAEAITVTPRITLRIAPRSTHNDETIYWHGRIAGGPYPRTGIPLLMQVREGRRWQAFHEIVSRKKGKFAYHYTFRRTTEPTTYSFRAALPSTGAVGYPYGPGASRAVSVYVG